ncbi:MAG TPA: TadE family protein [Planctomycetota bacterium]|jgi:hypothetical protein|nr:TadE family protein [Planctomycetota bacterium]
MERIRSIGAQRRLRNERAPLKSGISLVETALALPIFLLLLFGIVDLGRVLFAHMTLQHAVREAGRFAVTGRALPGMDGEHPRYDSIAKVVVQDSLPFELTASDVQISSARGGIGNPGGPGDRVTIALAYPVHLITPLIGRFFGPSQEFVVRVSTTFRNEPFPPRQAP